MERYIDIDKAIPMMIQACVDIVGHGITQVDAVRIASMLEDASTEDVVPRSEVEELEKQLNDYERICGKLRVKDNHAVILVGKETEYIPKKVADGFKNLAVKQAKQEVAREIFLEMRNEIELALDSNYKARNANGYGEFGEYVNGKIHALRGIDDFIAELEKKYIGEVTDNEI